MVGGLGATALSLIVGWGMYKPTVAALLASDLWMTSLGGVTALSPLAWAQRSQQLRIALAESTKLLDEITLYQPILFGALVGSSSQRHLTTPILFLLDRLSFQLIRLRRPCYAALAPLDTHATATHGFVRTNAARSL